MLAYEFQQFLARDAVLDEVDFNHIHVAEVVECVLGVVNVGHTTTHACSEVAARLAEHHHTTSRHVFAAVVAGSFDDGNGT